MNVTLFLECIASTTETLAQKPAASKISVQESSTQKIPIRRAPTQKRPIQVALTQSDNTAVWPFLDDIKALFECLFTSLQPTRQLAINDARTKSPVAFSILNSFFKCKLLRNTHYPIYNAMYKAEQVNNVASSTTCNSLPALLAASWLLTISISSQAQQRALPGRENATSITPVVPISPATLAAPTNSTVNSGTSSPRLVGTGSSVVLQRGNIDTDRLSKLTEEKLQEIRARVLRNSLVGFFNDNRRFDEETSPLKNFTSYSYTYQLLEALTSGKSKATLTRQVSGLLTEYAYVYAFARYLEASRFSNNGSRLINAAELSRPQNQNFVVAVVASTREGQKQVDFSTERSLARDSARYYRRQQQQQQQQEQMQQQIQQKSRRKFQTSQRGSQRIITPGSLAKPITSSKRDVLLEDPRERNNDKTFRFNFMLDYAYSVILAHQKKHPEDIKFRLARGLDDLAFQSWYEEDNLYAYYNDRDRFSEHNEDVEVYKRNEGTIASLPAPLRDANDPLQSSLPTDPTSEAALGAFLKLTNDAQLAISYVQQLKVGKQLNSLTPEQRDVIKVLLLPNDPTADETLTTFLKVAAEARATVSYITQIEKGRQLESLTPEQFKAIKALLREFAERFRSLSTDNVVAGVLEVFVENLQREPLDPAKLDGDGYFYLDAESVTVTLYEQFAKYENRGALKYVGLVGNIGFNYLHFINSPTIRDDNGNTLRDIYLASEKLGLKYKIRNWRYIRSAQAGQTYRYYGRTPTPLHQQKQPLISDLHVAVTGSGLLYNIVNTKTDESFNYGLVQGSIGVTFFNNLCFDASIGSTFTNKTFGRENIFFAVSVDVPLLDYILAGRKK